MMSNTDFISINFQRRVHVASLVTMTDGAARIRQLALAPSRKGDQLPGRSRTLKPAKCHFSKTYLVMYVYGNVP
jgi:hypothetical protein